MEALAHAVGLKLGAASPFVEAERPRAAGGEERARSDAANDHGFRATPLGATASRRAEQAFFAATLLAIGWLSFWLLGTVARVLVG